MTALRWQTVCSVALALATATGAAAVDSASTPPPVHAAPLATGGIDDAVPTARRPRIGLVLSGGGARGLAHVGVLKVLEQMQIPVDVIAGTSMGAIIGGLYASGMRADELERELLRLDWDTIFAPRIERQHLSQRRKEEDFEVSPLLELGLRDGELLAPRGAVSSRGLESLLRHYTLPVRDVNSFDALPIPFRAVATDMETGEPMVMDGGDLALALRSSMSVPGVFAPTEVDGHILGDGGLVNNTPVSVARALGAEVLIVVNIGTPLAGRDTLGSALGLTQQTINILTEQNVQRSLATLKAHDVLIAPMLGTYTSADFSAARELMALGAAGARGRSDRLSPLSMSAREYTLWRQAHAAHKLGRPQLAAVRIEGSTVTNPQRLIQMLEARPGQTFDLARAERDTHRLASAGDYTRTDYQLRRDANGDALVFEVEDKPWGPNYLRVGLDLSTDFRGRSAFNLKLSHNRHWLTANGTEWRNRLQIGEVPSLSTELYHPLAWTASRADDWFVAAHATAERRRLGQYAPTSGEETAVFRRDTLRAGVDLGQPWGEIGELRLGWAHQSLSTVPQIVSSSHAGPTGRARWAEDGLRARVVFDQLDAASFPRDGYRAEAEVGWGYRSGDLSGRFSRVEAQAQWVYSAGLQTLSLYGAVQMADSRPALSVPRYRLGGFHQLSGYHAGQLTGNDVLLLRANWYRRLNATPTLTRGFFVGASLEAGNAWAQRSDMRLSGLRTGTSVYLGADTGIGPLYLGLTHAPGGSTGVVLFIGRP
jgi:NTE family protein